MRVLQFAFGDDPRPATTCRTTIRANAVVYTGTHDNDTTVGWFRSGAGEGRLASRIHRPRDGPMRCGTWPPTAARSTGT